MSITRKDFGAQLKRMIEAKKSMEFIAFWIHDIYINYDNQDDNSFRDILYNLMMMDAGPEFEYTYEELNVIADKLIAGEDVIL